MRYLAFLLLTACNSIHIDSQGGDVQVDNGQDVGHKGEVGAPIAEALKPTITIPERVLR